MVSVRPITKEIPKRSFVTQGPDAITNSSGNLAPRETAVKLSSNLNNQDSGLLAKGFGSKPVFVNIVDFVKKNTARAMWGLGFGTASLAIMSYFLIGSTILSLFFAVPTLMAFFIGHSLGRNVIKGKSTLFKKPLEQLDLYVKNPQLLDTEIVQALLTVEELKDLALADPNKKDEIHGELVRFRDMIRAKNNQAQLATEGIGLKIKQDTERLLETLEIAVNTTSDLSKKVD